MKKKLLKNFILFIALFILFYTFYRSEITWHGLRRTYYSTYYFIGLIFLLFYFINLILSENNKIYLNIFLISLIFSLYLFEAYLNLIVSDEHILETKSNIYKLKTNKNYDKRTKYEVYNDLKKVENNISVAAPPAALHLYDENKNIFPFSGKSNSKTIVCNENGYFSIFQSDRYGFNNPDYEWDKDEIEYLIIGDSLAFGECVNRPNDIASILRKLSNKAVINLGYGSNGPIIEYAALREYYPKNTKKILWLYSEINDLFDINEELKNKVLKNYFDNEKFTQNLKIKQDLIDEIVLNKIYLERNVKTKFNIKEFLIYFVKFTKLRNLISPHEYTPNENFLDLFKKVKQFAKTNNSEIYFVYMPGATRYLAVQYDQYYNEVKKIIENLGISIIDIHSEVFAKEENPLNLFPFQMMGHYTEEGYEKAAKVIYNKTNIISKN